MKRNIFPGVRTYIGVKERERAVDASIERLREIEDEASYYQNIGEKLFYRIRSEFGVSDVKEEDVRTEKQYQDYKSTIERLMLETMDNIGFLPTDDELKKSTHVMVKSAGTDDKNYTFGGTIDDVPLGSIGELRSAHVDGLSADFPGGNLAFLLTYREVELLQVKVVKEEVTVDDLEKGDFVRVVRAGKDGRNYIYGCDTDLVPLGSIGVVDGMDSCGPDVIFPDVEFGLDYSEVQKIELKEMVGEERKARARQKIQAIIAKLEQEYKLADYEKRRKQVVETESGNLRNAGVEQEEIDRLLEEILPGVMK